MWTGGYTGGYAAHGDPDRARYGTDDLGLLDVQPAPQHAVVGPMAGLTGAARDPRRALGLRGSCYAR